MSRFLIFVFVLIFQLGFAQAPENYRPTQNTAERFRSLPSDTLVKKDTIRLGNKDFKIISHKKDTVELDSSLHIKKHYRFNFLRRDDFEYMSFENMGQGYVSLTGDYKENNQSYLPFIGAKAKHFGYMEADQVHYYNVPIPTSEAAFITSIGHGQFLDLFITFNTSRRFNISIENTGFRSVGKYLNEDATQGNFRTSFNYRSKNSKYSYRGHFDGQRLSTEENGGLQNPVGQFESGDSRYLDRKIVDVRFSDAVHNITGKRYYFDQNYILTRVSKDSIQKRKSALSLGHVMSYETRSVQFAQGYATEFFGEASQSSISDRAQLKLGKQEFSATFSNKLLGELTARAQMNHYNYRLTTTSKPDSLTNAVMEDRELVLGGKYNKKVGGFQLKADLKYTLVGSLTDYSLNTELSGKIKDQHIFKARLLLESKMPDFNYLLYQSDYDNYNWDHRTDFSMIHTQQLRFETESKWIGNIDAKIRLMDNYTYLSFENPSSSDDYTIYSRGIKPMQTNSSVKHLSLKYNKEFHFGKWAFDNTIMYQKVDQKQEALFVPQLITRNTLYFTSDVFAHAMLLQTGVSFKYYSAYRANAYNPVLGEFYTRPQGDLIGAYPLVDFFINARVRQTRIFFKAEHLNAPLTGYDYYVAPSYPFRDFVIRFGLVWDFFN